MTASPWMTIDEAAAYGRVSVPTLRGEIKARRLAAYRVGGHRVFRLRASDLDAWLLKFATPVAAS